MPIDRVVLDTNVLVSTVLSPLGPPFACLRVSAIRLRLVSSGALLAEFETAINRPRVTRFARPETLAAVRRAFRHDVELFEPVPLPPTCRNPKDDLVLATVRGRRRRHRHGRRRPSRTQSLPRHRTRHARRLS
jgi:putative PIN family toxin of toxin-antitoxin system